MPPAEPTISTPSLTVSARPSGLSTAEHYPSLFTMAGTALRAAAQFAASGFAFADLAVVDQRRAICAACPRWDASTARCRLCGCKTEAKIRSAAESCPDDPPRRRAGRK
jgi:hypothetical protein